MTNEPKLEVSTDAFGHVTYSITHEGVLLTKEQAESVAERIKALEELLHDVYSLHWNGLDCTECPWFDKCDTEGGCPWLGIMRDRMDELGIPRGQ
jgi:CRISPR/Cas system-associated exonuclease Cas4 (RecB family)